MRERERERATTREIQRAIESQRQANGQEQAPKIKHMVPAVLGFGHVEVVSQQRQHNF